MQNKTQFMVLRLAVKSNTQFVQTCSVHIDSGTCFMLFQERAASFRRETFSFEYVFFSHNLVMLMYR